MPFRYPISTLSTLLVAGVAILSVTAFGQAGRSSSGSGDMLVYFGTYTGEKSKGVYVSRLDLASGALSRPELAGETASPSFLAVHPSQNFLYAINEIGNFQGKASGSVSAFAIDRNTGRLTALNQQPSVGPGPAHLVVDKAGRNALVANYGGGSVAVVPIGPDGALKPPSAFIQHTGSSVNPQRQKEPHAHSINLDPANRFAYAADLGLDKVLVYRFDADKGSLVANDPPFAQVAAGAGPRHFAIHPNGRFAYVINELNLTVTAFRRDSDGGSLTDLQTISTLPPGQKVESDLQHSGCAGASVWTIPLRVQSRTRQHRRLRNRPEHRTADLPREPADTGQHPAWIRHRSKRQLSARGQSAIGLSRRLPDRQADGTAHADRTHHRSRCAGMREIR